MRSTSEKRKALLLRQKGFSINEIASNLNTPKSTVSLWCRNIVLTPSQLQKLEEKQRMQGQYGSLRAAEKKRAARMQNESMNASLGSQDIGNLTKRDLFILGIGLYWGEGYKRGNNEFGFSNADPDMIRMFLRWVNEIYDIKTEDLILRLSINSAYAHKVNESIRFWINVTGVSRSQFTKTSLIKTKLRKYDPHNSRPYFGTLRIKVRRATQLHRRVLGSLAYLSQSVAKTMTQI